MKRKFTALAAAAALSLTLAAPAANAMQQEFNMLTGAVYNSLSQMGLPTDNIQNLTLSEIAQIQLILTGGGSDGTKKNQVQAILKGISGNR